jgi:hypothetical protein
MNELKIYGTGNGNTETEYPKGDTNGSLSGASTISKDDNTPTGGLDGAGDSYQNKNPQLDRVLARWCESTVRSDGSKKRRKMDAKH